MYSIVITRLALRPTFTRKVYAINYGNGTIKGYGGTTDWEGEDKNGFGYGFTYGSLSGHGFGYGFGFGSLQGNGKSACIT